MQGIYDNRTTTAITTKTRTTTTTIMMMMMIMMTMVMMMIKLFHIVQFDTNGIITAKTIIIQCMQMHYIIINMHAHT